MQTENDGSIQVKKLHSQLWFIDKINKSLIKSQENLKIKKSQSILKAIF